MMFNNLQFLRGRESFLISLASGGSVVFDFPLESFALLSYPLRVRKSKTRFHLFANHELMRGAGA